MKWLQKAFGVRRSAAVPGFCLLIAVIVAGCASSPRRSAEPHRKFDFALDTFAFPNQLVWHYGYDDRGKWRATRREEEPDYTLHCFVLARSAAQFFEWALFDASLPRADQKTYRALVRKVVRRSLRKAPEARNRITIPGYADLRSFSRDNEALLKQECGSFWHSYFQRGHWRMVLPFSRGQQLATARRLVERVESNQISVVHLVRFPRLTINHAVLIFAREDAEDGLRFLAYDPNDPEAPIRLAYDSPSRTFRLQSTDYFPGGRVDVYQVYHQWNY